MLTGFFLFLFMGYPPFKSLMSFFVSPLLTGYGLSELGVKAAPLIMIAVGLAIGFRANVWNIGAEGQLTMGALAGGGVGARDLGPGRRAGSCRRCWWRASWAASPTPRSRPSSRPGSTSARS